MSRYRIGGSYKLCNRRALELGVDYLAVVRICRIRVKSGNDDLTALRPHLHRRSVVLLPHIRSEALVTVDPELCAEDVKVDDSSVKPLFEGEEDPVYAGEWYTGLYLSLENLQAAGVEDFKDVYFTMVVKVGDKEELRQKVHITRDAFQEE